MSRSLLLIACLALPACSLFKEPRPAIRRAIPATPAALHPDESTISVTWVGHATALIRIDDRWFLTDPVFGERIALVYPRRVEAAIDPAELPPLSAVLISHAHFDHLDPDSLELLPATRVVAAPPGAVTFLPDAMPAQEIAGLHEWETWEADGVKITAVPALHGDGRYLVDKWNHHSHTAFVIEYRERTVYFAGDTGLDREGAGAISDRFDVDVALIPVGPAGRWKWVEDLRDDVHVTPDQAMELFEICGAQWMVPIHFGTFFNDPDYERPFVEDAIARSGRARDVRLLEIGETTEFLY